MKGLLLPDPAPSPVGANRRSQREQCDVASVFRGRILGDRPEGETEAVSHRGFDPTIVISSPDAHHERSVISDFTAPTRKWATTARIPLIKKH